MTIPTFTVVPNTASPSTFSSDMDSWLSEIDAWTAAVNATGTAYALTVTTTSTTSLTIGTGSQSLTVATGLGFLPGMEIMVASTASPTNRMAGSVTSYDSGTGALVVNVTTAGGSGTIATWTISPTTIANFNAQTFTSLTLAGTVTETPYALSGTDVDPANGTIQSKTLSGTWTVTSSLADGQSVLLHITKGAHSIVWPTMVWVYGAPTLSSTVVSVVILWKVGSTLYGCYAGPAS